MALSAHPHNSLIDIQTNLQHSHTATANLRRELEVKTNTVALIQEPWIRKGRICGLNNIGGKILLSTTIDNPRTCIYTPKHACTTLMTEFCSRDLTSIRLKEPSSNLPDVVIASAYLPGDADIPTPELAALAHHCEREGLELIISADTNAHHALWGSRSNNRRGEEFVSFLLSTNLNIINVGSEPIFVTSRAQTIIDLTLASEHASQHISNWHVSNEASCSDKFNFEMKLKLHDGPETKRIRTRKTECWRNYCTNIENNNTTNIENNNLGSLKKPDGEYTKTDSEASELLLKTHFPGCRISDVMEKWEDRWEKPPDDTDWDRARKVVNHDKLRWAINSFLPFKAPGLDGVFPGLLRWCDMTLLNHLVKMYRGCLAHQYVPLKWREVKVVFIPKPGKGDYTQPKSHRPISLTSFLLKVLERLIDRVIRETALVSHPLHLNQHAYSMGKSTESALHRVVAYIEDNLNHKRSTLATFIDIEGAFDKTNFTSSSQALSRHGVDSTISGWIDSMLRYRAIQFTVSEVTRGVVARGCPQGGVLSPLLWNIVVDELIAQPNDQRFLTIGYADDLTILISLICHNGPVKGRRRLNIPPGKSITAADLVEEETTGRDIILSPLLSDSDQSSEFVIKASGTSRNIENVDSNQETEIVAPTTSPSSTQREIESITGTILSSLIQTDQSMADTKYGEQSHGTLTAVRNVEPQPGTSFGGPRKPKPKKCLPRLKKSAKGPAKLKGKHVVKSKKKKIYIM
ncbi:unnamed protein product [Arctia plantaginis]|uniref:Reverse transcriptase domain-containing protein n=1 Tax=Arctia plantaginis TaxID=874455 RepID=A0A8S1BHK6_ARCPL|nr:unnamed protein product [Arctia plantaginis]